MNWNDCLVYIDDVLIWSRTFSEHLHKLEQVFKAFEKAGLRIEGRKCHICCSQVPYIGHLLSFDGIFMNPKRDQAIADMFASEKRQTLESFLGLVSYYSRFVPNIFKQESPLREIVKDTKLFCSESVQRSFDSIKRAIATNTVLAHPDPAATLVVDTDASDVGLGAVLSQIGHDRVERPIAFASRVLSVNENSGQSLKGNAWPKSGQLKTSSIAISTAQSLSFELTTNLCPRCDPLQNQRLVSHAGY